MEPQRDYEKSAAVYQVLGRYKAERDYEFSRKTDFTTEFMEFSHPNIVLADNYSLYTFTDDEAVFVDCGDCDIFDKTKAFVYDTQYQNAIKMVTMPLESFHIVAKEVTIPDIPIVHLANHRRCGSTLFTKVFEGIPNALSLSETNGFTQLAEMSLHNGDQDYEKIKKMLYSAILMTIKHASARKSSCMLMKHQSSILFITEMMVDVFPSIKQVYMYRQGLGFVQSYEKLMVANSWDPLSTELACYWGGVGQHRLLKSYTDHIKPEDVAQFSSFTKWAIIWVASTAAFKKLNEEHGLELKSFKFEHMIKNPKVVLSKVFAHVGIPLDQLPDIDTISSKDSQTGTPFPCQHLLKKMVFQFGNLLKK